MFDYFKKVEIASRTNDELLYEFVLSELETGAVSKGLWGKALANSGGDSAYAKSIYMQYRVQSIKDIFTAQKIAYNELSKSKLFQYIQDKIFPITNNYTNLMAQTDVIETEDYSVSKTEETLYEEVANELSKDIRKEGLWLKAIQNTDGDEKRALSLYIKYRSESIKTQKKLQYEEELKIKEIKNKEELKIKEIKNKEIKQQLYKEQFEISKIKFEQENIVDKFYLHNCVVKSVSIRELSEKYNYHFPDLLSKILEINKNLIYKDDGILYIKKSENNN